MQILKSGCSLESSRRHLAATRNACKNQATFVKLTPGAKLRSDATRYTAPQTHPWLVTRGIACMHDVHQLVRCHCLSGATSAYSDCRADCSVHSHQGCPVVSPADGEAASTARAASLQTRLASADNMQWDRRACLDVTPGVVRRAAHEGGQGTRPRGVCHHPALATRIPNQTKRRIHASVRHRTASIFSGPACTSVRVKDRAAQRLTMSPGCVAQVSPSLAYRVPAKQQKHHHMQLITPNATLCSLSRARALQRNESAICNSHCLMPCSAQRAQIQHASHASRKSSMEHPLCWQPTADVTSTEPCNGSKHPITQPILNFVTGRLGVTCRKGRGGGVAVREIDGV